MVVLQPLFNSDNGVNSGQVRVYENQLGTWTQIGQDIEGEVEFDFFGYSVSLSSNGNILAIGATNSDTNGSDSGNVRIFKNESGIWTQVGASIVGEAAGDRSGYRISLNPSDLKNITIYNNLGQEVLTSKKYIVNTSKLSTGLYIVEIETNIGKGSKKLIIEQKIIILKN